MTAWALVVHVDIEAQGQAVTMYDVVDAHPQLR